MPRSSLSAHIALAICSAAPAEAIALAACAFALTGSLTKDNAMLVQLTPAGTFKPDDGRDIPVAAWHIDEAIANKVIARFQSKRNPRVLDYEHQTLKKEENGQPAPAAGWITQLQWEPDGLFGMVQLNARARHAIEAGEYRYISPVFTYDRRTGDVLDIQMAALTNTPAIDGMQPLELRAAATFGINSQEDNTMNKLLLAICTALALNAETTTEDQAVEAFNARMKNDPLADVRKALGVAIDAKPEAVVAACSAIKIKADASIEADPAKFVPLSQFEQVKTELAALTAKQVDGEVATLVEKGLADGRLLAAQKDWATSLGKKDVAALTAYLDSAQPIAALTRSQTNGKPPEKTDANPHALTAEELAVCSATGISAEDFAKSKAETAKAA